jgi:hypothetical protein
MPHSNFLGRSLWLLPFLFLSLLPQAFAQKDTIKGIQLSSHKKKSSRTFIAHLERTVPAPLHRVKDAIMNFTDKCNNDFRSQRKWIDKGFDCAFKNGNLIESKRHDDLLPFKPEANEVTRFILSRHGNNRGAFTYLDLVTEKKYLNDKKKKVIEISQEMLSDKKAKEMIKVELKNTMAFNKIKGLFVLTEISSTETLLSYTYTSQTTHWMLNKEMIVGEVFSSMANGIDDLWQSIIQFTQYPAIAPMDKKL